MRRIIITLASVMLLSASAAFAGGSDNKNAGDGGQWGGSPAGPTGNLMTSGVNPAYHSWMWNGYGYAGNVYASVASPRARHMVPRGRGYIFGSHEEEGR